MAARTHDAPEPRSPFHEGEREMHERLGIGERMESAGRRMLRDRLPADHREFLETLPFVVVAAVGEDGRVWTSLLAGLPGFVRSPDDRTLVIGALPATGDPLPLRPGAALAVLGIEPSTRSRVRANGFVSSVTGRGFAVTVGQSFGNCPKYIRPRDFTFVREPSAAPSPASVSLEGPSLSPHATALIAAADTFFIGSAARPIGSRSAIHGADVSHRGGAPGFVHVATPGGRTVLTVPDYRGNNLFNTLGNVLANPRVGALFVDFEHGTVLSLTGEASVLWDRSEPSRFGGVERALEIRVERGVLLGDALPLRSIERE
jgi:uncharacterized protein